MFALCCRNLATLQLQPSDQESGGSSGGTVAHSALLECLAFCAPVTELGISTFVTGTRRYPLIYDTCYPLLVSFLTLICVLPICSSCKVPFSDHLLNDESWHHCSATRVRIVVASAINSRAKQPLCNAFPLSSSVVLLSKHLSKQLRFKLCLFIFPSFYALRAYLTQTSFSSFNAASRFVTTAIRAC